MLKTSKGFTLIELMIVVIIIALLAGIGIPSYLKQVVKTRRSDAKVALSELAQLQESFFADNQTYTADLTKLGKTAQSGIFLSPEGYYEIKISKADARSFLLEATPKGAQADDDKTCQKFTLNAASKKEAKDSGNKDTSDECWG
jgi:type IV pilus assembly protein PilE